MATQTQKAHDCSCVPSQIELNSAAFSRRLFLQCNAMGIGGMALAWLLQQDKLLGAPEKPVDTKFTDLKPRLSNFPARATAMISLFMHGGPSHVDLLDPKPELTKHSGKDYQGQIA